MPSKSLFPGALVRRIMSVSDRPNPAAVQVICLGHSRTGTSSMTEALDVLGFGPCYHNLNIMKEGRNDMPAWCKIFHGPSTPEDFDALLRGYRSALDQPVAFFPVELHVAYPNAKFILTTRDPEKWEASMKATLFPSIKAIRESQSRTPLCEALDIWNETCLRKYHNELLHSHPQEALLYHEERVKRAIPLEKLLVYQIGEGWDRLVKFLDVPKPDTPFPHLNDTMYFQKTINELGAGVNWDNC